MASQSIRHQLRDPWWWGRSFIWILTVALVSKGLDNRNAWLLLGSLVCGLLAGGVLALAKAGWLKGVQDLVRALRKPNAS